MNVEEPIGIDDSIPSIQNSLKTAYMDPPEIQINHRMDDDLF